MESVDYFKPWITESKWGVRIALFLILLCALFQFGSFALNQNFVIASSGAQPEDITFALQIAYVAIIPSISINFRLVQYFQMRTYLIVGIISCLILSYLSMNTDDLILFCIFRFLNGLAMIMISGGVLILVFSRLEKAKTQIVGLSVLFGTVLGNGFIIGLVASELNSFADWKQIYNYLMATMILSLIIVLMVLRKKSGHIRQPLGEVDKTGWFFLGLFTGAIAYIFIYGPRHEWFQDRNIIYMSIFGLLMLILFVIRQRLAIIPIIDIKALSSSGLILGLVLLAFYYGLKDSVNLIYFYAGNVLLWSPKQVMTLGLFNVTAVAISMWISAELLLRKILPFQGFLLSGFSLLLIYHIYMYYELTPDLNLANLIPAILIQGAASGMLFVPIILFSLSSVPQSSIVTGIVAGAFTRFIASLTTVATFYSFQLYFSRHFRSSFLAHLTPDNNQYRDFLTETVQSLIHRGVPLDQSNLITSASLSKKLAVQEQLLSLRYIFLIFSLISAGILLLVIIVSIYRAIKGTQQNSTEHSTQKISQAIHKAQ